MAYTPYNPLDKRHLAESIVGKLEERPLEALPPLEQVVGAGIYAIYYDGSNPLYAPLVKANKAKVSPRPIYVGKAVPAGARKGGFDLVDQVGKDVQKRLKHHAKSIEQGAGLELRNFRCRYLMVDDIWIPLGEQLLIDKYRPIWNSLLDGFGINVPGSGRGNQKRSMWDEVHPGRDIAKGLPPNSKGREALTKEIHQFWQAGR
jgi:hypothetical protein